MENRQGKNLSTLEVLHIMKKKVVLRAPVLSQSGYGVHSRQIARWLLERDDIDLIVQPVQWGITPWYLDPEEKDGLIGKLMSLSKPSDVGFDVSFQVQLPNEWDPSLAKLNIGVTAGVETDICNPDWIDNCLKMDRVIVPSTFTKGVFEKTALRSGDATKIDKILGKIEVIPESFVDAIFSEGSIDVDFETPFNFLLVGQMTGRAAENDRKNIFNTIKWFCETFKDDSEVGLVIKTNNGRDTKIDRTVTIDILNQILMQVRKGPYPRIHLLHGMFTDDEMVGIYRHPKIKAFLSLTRGEGYGLPLLESAAAGLPIIATNWSGHLDFLKYGKYVKLDYELRQIPTSRIDNKIFVAGASWAEVSEQDVKRRLRKFRLSPAIPSNWAQELAKPVKEQFSYEAIRLKYDELLKGVL